jgi:hypothetical protein
LPSRCSRSIGDGGGTPGAGGGRTESTGGNSSDAAVSDSGFVSLGSGTGPRLAICSGGVSGNTRVVESRDGASIATATPCVRAIDAVRVAFVPFAFASTLGARSESFGAWRENREAISDLSMTESDHARSVASAMPGRSTFC